MKRALILIITLSVLSVGIGMKVDSLQRTTALDYLEGVQAVRGQVLDGNAALARQQQAVLYDRWQQDAHWMNFLIDHHHTRTVDLALRRLSTALQDGDRLTILLILDETADALQEIAIRDRAVPENIF